MYTALSFFVAIIGALAFVIASRQPNPSPCVMELGRIAYAMGLLAFLLRVTAEALALPHFRG